MGPSAADDVVQETWLRALRGLDGFRRSSSLRVWLTGIALNVCRERFRLRRAANLDALQHDGPTRATETSPANGPANENRGDLLRALQRLPEGAREVLLLHDVEGYTHAEIAALLAISPGTSKSQLHRARTALRTLLDTKEMSHG